MTEALPALVARLEPGETILIHHRPDAAVRAYWKRFFLMLFPGLMAVGCLAALTISPVILGAPWMPMAGAILLAALVVLLVFHLVERRGPRDEAVVTARRILWGSGAELALRPGQTARASGSAVRIYDGMRLHRLVFPADGPALAAQVARIIAAREGQQDG